MTESDPESQQIHEFSDASKKAYAAVIYLRSTYGNGSMNVCIIASKLELHQLKPKQYLDWSY